MVRLLPVVLVQAAAATLISVPAGLLSRAAWGQQAPQKGWQQEQQQVLGHRRQACGVVPQVEQARPLPMRRGLGQLQQWQGRLPMCQQPAA